MISEQPLRPFFIVGSPRSGTTLLRFMLGSHSRLAVPDETGFLPFLRRDPDQRLDVSETTAVLERIGRLNRFWKGIVSDGPAFYASLPQPRLPFLLDALYRQQGGLPPATRWGDKTPLYIRYIPQLLAIFPRAQIIHVVRDGRDTSLSARAKWGADHRYMDIYYLLRSWQLNVTAGRRALEALPPSQFFSLHYEDLVDDPQHVLRQVCEFLGEPFEPAMLEHTELAKTAGGGIDEHREAQEPVHARSIERWRLEMTPFEMRLADDLVGETLQEWGYTPAGEGPLTGIDQLHKTRLVLKFAITNTSRTLLYRAGLLTLNRNRR